MPKRSGFKSSIQEFLTKSNDEILRMQRITEQKMIEQLKIKELIMRKKTEEINHKMKMEIENLLKGVRVNNELTQFSDIVAVKKTSKSKNH